MLIEDILKSGSFESQGFCGIWWDDSDGTYHSCYLNIDHNGGCCCGFCEEGIDHLKKEVK